MRLCGNAGFIVFDICELFAEQPTTSRDRVWEDNRFDNYIYLGFIISHFMFHCCFKSSELYNQILYRVRWENYAKYRGSVQLKMLESIY